jgi:uncharacterized membrane protein
MKRTRLFDKTQLIIAIIGVASFITTIVLYIPMFLTAEVYYNENGLVDKIEYNFIIQSIFSIFSILNILMLIWFIIRLITYKMRIKEEDSL